jgi:hypothetical protein
MSKLLPVTNTVDRYVEKIWSIASPSLVERAELLGRSLYRCNGGPEVVRMSCCCFPSATYDFEANTSLI